MTPEARAGLYMNIHVLEAREDIRQALVMGSLLSKQGAEYLKMLHGIAYWNDLETVDALNARLDTQIRKEQDHGSI